MDAAPTLGARVCGVFEPVAAEGDEAAAGDAAAKRGEREASEDVCEGGAGQTGRDGGRLSYPIKAAMKQMRQVTLLTEVEVSVVTYCRHWGHCV